MQKDEITTKGSRTWRQAKKSKDFDDDFLVSGKGHLSIQSINHSTGSLQPRPFVES